MLPQSSPFLIIYFRAVARIYARAWPRTKNLLHQTIGPEREFVRQFERAHYLQLYTLELNKQRSKDQGARLNCLIIAIRRRMMAMIPCMLCMVWLPGSACVLNDTQHTRSGRPTDCVPVWGVTTRRPWPSPYHSRTHALSRLALASEDLGYGIWWCEEKCWAGEELWVANLRKKLEWRLIAHITAKCSISSLGSKVLSWMKLLRGW